MFVHKKKEIATSSRYLLFCWVLNNKCIRLMLRFQFMYFILTHNAACGIIYLTREHSLNGLPCWFLTCLHRQNLLRVRRCNFFAKNHFYLLLFQVSDNKRRNTKKQCCKLYHARKRFPGHLIITPLYRASPSGRYALCKTA